MGRLLAAGVLVVGALIAVLVVNGTGPLKPEEKESSAPARQSSKVAETAPGGSGAKKGTPVARVRPGAVVRMKNLRFRPESVSVKPGQSVKFVNDDTVAHTVLEDFGPRSGEIALVDSKRILPGETFSFVARGAGPIAYVCTLHPTVMVGQVLIEKPAA